MSNINTSLCQFDFNAIHNGIQCIASLRPEDRGTARQYRFTAAMLADCYNVNRMTIQRRIETLMDTGDLTDAQNCASVMLPDSLGRECVKTKLYDLTVFNKIGMTFIESDRAVEVRRAFNDVLVKHETHDAMALPDFTNPAEAARAWANQYEKCVAAEKALAEEKEQHAKDNRDWCAGLEILETQKSQIATRQLATTMGRLGNMTKENARLVKDNERLKDECGRGQNWSTLSHMKDEWERRFHHPPSWKKLIEFSTDLGDESKMPIKDVLETFRDGRGQLQEKKVNRYHIDAWKRYERYEELLLTGDKTY